VRDREMQMSDDLERLESEIERRWLASNAKAAGLMRDPEKVAEATKELERGSVLYEILELVRGKEGRV